MNEEKRIFKNQEDIVKNFIEIQLVHKDNFLKVRETLSRIGIASKYQKTLFQTCHILCKYKTRYFVCHFKELFLLDGKEADITENDIARRNTIANLLASWDLIKLVDPEKSKNPIVPMNNIKIIQYKDKCNWELVEKYTVGIRK